MPVSRIFPCIFALLCALGALFAQSSTGANLQSAVLSPAAIPAASAKAVIIPVKGMVKDLLFTTIKRRTEEARKNGVELIIYSIQSDGGEVGAAMEMSNYVFTLDDKIKTIAFIDEKAYSAAALFALACDDLYMKDASVLGDCQPIMITNEGYKSLGEKVQSPLRERFRSYAEKNGYPPLLAEAMVKEELQVYRLQRKSDKTTLFMRSEDYDILGEEAKKEFENIKIVSHKGELLTMSTKEAQEYGFSMGTHANANALLVALGYPSEAEVKIVEPTEEEKFIDLIDGAAPFLLALAIFCLYLEFKTGGSGLFGSVSAVAFAAFFLGKFYTGQAHYLEVMMFVLGAALLAIEIFVIPGFGLAGIAGFILILASLVLAMQNLPTQPGPAKDPGAATEKGFEIATGESISWGAATDVLLDSLARVAGAFLGATLLFVLVLLILPRLKLRL